VKSVVMNSDTPPFLYLMLLSLHLRHRLFEVGDDVFGILDAHRE
jgi:hypothetical protein